MTVDEAKKILENLVKTSFISQYAEENAMKAIDTLVNYCNEKSSEMYQKGREDAIEEYTNKLRKRIEGNKIIAEAVANHDKFKELALTNIDLEEIAEIVEQMKGDSE